MPNVTKKGSREVRKHAARVKKSKFKGNQFTAETDPEFVSTSAKKLKTASYEDIQVDQNIGYVICNFFTIFSFLSDILVCKSCGGDVKFDRTSGAGISFKLIVTCNCDTQYCNSSPCVNKTYEVNRRFMFAMRMLGVGLQSLRTFCSIMDITCSFSNNIYYSFLSMLDTAAQSVFEIVQRKAVDEEISLNAEHGNEARQLSVSGDGSWKKRGFSSLFGISTLIGKYSGKVVDFVVKSAYCQSCANWALRKGTIEYDEWHNTHGDNCTANHHGSAGKMEVDAMREMFARSEKSLGVKYSNYIGDGDTKTFKALLDLDPYDDIAVQKKECVGHVQKRMGSRLRAVKKGTRGLGGKGAGKLTDKLIADLTVYYGLAIRRHPDSEAKMKDAVWATFLHKCSTDKVPQHSKCPEGVNSWCKWRVAEATGELDSFKHDHPLCKDVQKAIKPVYEALSADDLLHRCLGGNTQNCNESFNACVWRLAPKHLHSSTQTINSVTAISACLFNEGNSSLLKILNAMGISVGLGAVQFAQTFDEQRRQAAERKVSQYTRMAYIEKKNKAIAQQEQFELEEGILYSPGIAD